jgi:RHS repeat-associated protein
MAGAKTIAMRTIEGSTNTLNWLLTDLLGSTSTTANEDGNWNSTIKYTAFGETRDSSGVTPTKYRYTGQLLEAEVGLYYYVARFYDPVTMHFTQADKFIPNSNSSKSYDRYAYVMNNPLIYNDPTGNDPWYIEGWSESYIQQQDGNTCAVVSIAVSLSILLGYPYKQEDIQRVFPHTYNFSCPIITVKKYIDPSLGSSYKFEVNKKNLAIGVVPDEQAIGINTMFPGTIKATSTKGTREDLLNNLKNGKPTMITIALPIDEGVGHVLVVIGYDESTEQFQFFDPAWGDEINESDFSERYSYNGYETFDEIWGSSNGVIESNSMVTVEKVSPHPLISGGGSYHLMNFR